MENREMFKHNEHAGRTAIRRNKMSAPTRWLMEEGRLGEPEDSLKILDYGAGQGDDYHRLKKEGFTVDAYDPHHHPFKREPSHYNYDVVLCNYVLNVTENDTEMATIMMLAMTKLRPNGVAYFTVRRDKFKEGKQRTGAYQRMVDPTVCFHDKSKCKSIRKCSTYEIYEVKNAI